MAISAQYGQSPEYFGGADYREALKQGYTIRDIKEYLDRNPSLLREQNVPGGGGLYDELARKANTFIGMYGGNEDTMAHSGLSGVSRALEAGLTFDEIREQAAREGVSFGQGAQRLFGQLDTSKEQLETLTTQQKTFEDTLTKQQSQFESRLLEQQRQAEESRKQLMIQMQSAGRAPAEVRMAQSQPLRRRGTTGYFGREGMRISGLNVPTSGLAISPNTTMRSGSFA